MTVRFVGSGPLQIAKTRFYFERYGQAADVPQELYEGAALLNAALLPGSQFDSLGHTLDELKKYARFESHDRLSPEFAAKRDRAWTMLVENKNSLKAARQEKEMANGRV